VGRLVLPLTGLSGAGRPVIVGLVPRWGRAFIAWDAGQRRVQSPRGDGKCEEHDRSDECADARSDDHLGGDGGGVGDKRAGVGPFLDGRKAWYHQCDCARQLPGPPKSSGDTRHSGDSPKRRAHGRTVEGPNTPPTASSATTGTVTQKAMTRPRVKPISVMGFGLNPRLSDGRSAQETVVRPTKISEPTSAPARYATACRSCSGSAVSPPWMGRSPPAHRDRADSAARSM
jgi:hypothetical protein